MSSIPQNVVGFLVECGFWSSVCSKYKNTPTHTMILPSQCMFYWMLTGQTTAVVLKWQRDTAGSPTLSDLWSDDKRPGVKKPSDTRHGSAWASLTSAEKKLDGGTQSQIRRHKCTLIDSPRHAQQPSQLLTFWLYGASIDSNTEIQCWVLISFTPVENADVDEDALWPAFASAVEKAVITA